MTVTPESFFRAIWMTVLEPAEMARQAKGMRIGAEPLWTALVLLAILNALLIVGDQYLSPVPAEMQAFSLGFSPFGWAALAVAYLIGSTLAIWKAGTFLYGSGNLEETLTLFVWFNTMRLVLLIIQMVLLFLSPALSGIFALVSAIAVFRAFLHFVDVLHDFGSLLKAFGCIILSSLAVGAALLILLTIIGVPALTGVSV
ncbi:YIP1 family protein [Yoonia sediminilitoris]|uniref:Yip1 domain-containing protein n=1 Tax=Yoonia sediminilitoris TaxID=1286148 RepID=A0A2T6KCU3_9RHOB|nr:YIP1 family protein [Yoonia sediminilitoris]PUB12781.1 hypothetical protein C8N45_10989 [Yoonia sediminilitoris]RCW94260.1 hypothetical protein DFP92_10989 [Yoonia sediminilitoris]